MVEREHTNQIMDQLYDVGARAIIVTSIHASRIREAHEYRRPVPHLPPPRGAGGHPAAAGGLDRWFRVPDRDHGAVRSRLHHAHRRDRDPARTRCHVLDAGPAPAGPASTT